MTKTITKICQHGELYPPRCRKRATLAVVYHSVFGTRRVTFRCPTHATVPRMIKTVGINDYFTPLAAAAAQEVR